MNKELPYWIALAHTPKVLTKKKNDIIVEFYNDDKTIIDFFEASLDLWRTQYLLTETEIDYFIQARNALPNFSFLTEDLINQGYDLIPIISKKYSPTLKKNLGRRYAPPLLYTKGNTQLMHQPSVAIVGARAASPAALTFTENVAKSATTDKKVVVSGFARGVDQQALVSAVKHKGQSIIVLPQGITTFQSGFKKYYQQIISGDVLVISTFYPNAPWSVGQAMARNPIIYGLASEIYVAESSNKGGTWSGAIDGLKKGRTIYVRKPNANEKNANSELIQKGAIAVDIQGEKSHKAYQIPTPNQLSIALEPKDSISNIDHQIQHLLKKKPMTGKEIITQLKLTWSPQKTASYLKKLDFIQITKGADNINLYQLTGIDYSQQLELF